MTAKEYLSQYRVLNARIDTKRAQIERLRLLARSAGGQAKSGSGRGSLPYDRVGELTAKIVDLEAEINSEIDALIDLEREIRSVISRIPNDNQRAVLEMKYLNGWTLAKIADVMNYSLINIKKIHGAALKSVYPIIPFDVV